MSPEMLEELDFAQGALGEDLFTKDICDLLDCDALVRLVVDRRAIRLGERERGELLAFSRLSRLSRLARPSLIILPRQAGIG